jgi:hypothetical protein
VTIRNDGGTGEIRTPDLMLRRHPLYPSELRSRELVENNCGLCDSIVDCGLALVCHSSATSRQDALRTSGQAGAAIGQVPFARSLICFASFSISSAFFTMPIDRIDVESVFSTSVFNCVARS